MSSFSILLTDKKEGETSFQSLYPIKKEYKGEKIGHAGTLDKFASGLMIVLVGGATRLNPVFSSMGKSYLASIEFGSETDTLDPEGTVVATSGLPCREDIDRILPTFLGRQMQTPPVYSAIHVDGRRAYAEARKGRNVDMPEREIEIHSIEKVSFDGRVLTIRVFVSKGTYIRSLARDIAGRLGLRAHLCALRRESIGPYSLDDVGNTDSIGLLRRTGLFSDMELDEAHKKEIDNGRIKSGYILSDSDAKKRYKFVCFSRKLYAIGEVGDDDRLRLIFRVDR